MPRRTVSKAYTPQRSESHTRSSWNRTHLVILFVLTILGFALRVEPVLSDSVHFSYDQGLDLFYVRRLVIDRKLSLIGRFTGLEGVFMGPLWTFMLAIPYTISGGNPAANVLFFAILGTAAIWGTYMLVRHLVSETAALLVALYTALASTFIATAHIILSPYPLVFLMIIYIWALWEVIETNRLRFWLLLGFTSGVFFQFEIGFAGMLLPATLVTLLLFKKLNYPPSRVQLASLLLLALPFLPQALFELRHDFIMSKAIVRTLTGENSSLGKEPGGFGNRALLRAGSLWEDASSAVAFRGKDTLAFLLVAVPATLGWLGEKREAGKRKRKLASMLLLIIVIFYGGFVFFQGPMWTWYRAGLPIVFILLLAGGWDTLFRQSKVWRWTAILLFTSLSLINIHPQSVWNRLTYREEGGVSTLRNQKLAVEAVFRDAGNTPFDLYVYTPPVYTYVWDHLLFWYAKPRFMNQPEEYGYQRTRKARNDFYLLIEPDLYRDREEGWKGNFKSHGSPLKTWSLPGGIRIEKWRVSPQESPEGEV